MFNGFTLFVGRRYTRAKRRNHFISFIALTSMLGIGLGVTVLITVLSVMNGFEKELRERILGMTPHVYIQSLSGKLEDWQKIKTSVEQRPRVEGAAPFVATQAMLKANGRNVFTFVQGIDPQLQQEVSIVSDHIISGSIDKLASRSYGIVLGKSLALSLGLSLGDKVTVIAAEGASATPAGVIMRNKRFTLVGVFEVKAEADSNLGLIHFEDAQRLLRYGDAVTGVQLKVDDVFRASEVAADVQSVLNRTHYTSDWTYMHGSLFSAIRMEKNMMFILLTFIIAVAAFNIVSTLVMVVQDKQADIAILRTLGAPPSSIMQIFVIQGSLNGIVGTLLGIIGGVSLSLYLPDIAVWIEKVFSVQILPGDVYFVSVLPSELKLIDVLKVSLSAFLMSFLATLYPAWRAAKTKPAEALRYE